MLELYPIFENNKLGIDLILKKNGKKYIDKFNRYGLLINFNTEKYYLGNKEYKTNDINKILKKFGIKQNDKNNINGLTVKQAIKRGIDYMNGKLKYI